MRFEDIVKMPKVVGGRERTYFEDQDSKEKLVGVYKRCAKPNEARSRFYLTKIIHLLYPKNIPDVFLSANDPNVIIRKKEDFGWENDLLMRYHFGKRFDAQPLTAAEEKKIAEAGERLRSDEIRAFRQELYALELMVDKATFNFGYDSDGNIKYGETFEAFMLDNSYFAFVRFNADKLRAVIEEKLDGDERKRALAYLERLEQIIKDENERRANERNANEGK